MLLSDFINNLTTLVEENPEMANLIVCTSKDDEGNGHSLVTYKPSIGSYDEEEREFTPEKVVNAICVN